MTWSEVMGAPGPRSRGFPSRSGCRRTYDRKLEEIFAAEEIIDDRKLDRLLGR